jgi:hypothetical protein
MVSPSTIWVTRAVRGCEVEGAATVGGRVWLGFCCASRLTGLTVGIVRALATVAEITPHVGAGVGGPGGPAVTAGAVGLGRGEGSGEYQQT